MHRQRPDLSGEDEWHAVSHRRSRFPGVGSRSLQGPPGVQCIRSYGGIQQLPATIEHLPPSPGDRTPGMESRAARTTMIGRDILINRELTEDQIRAAAAAALEVSPGVIYIFDGDAGPPTND